MLIILPDFCARMVGNTALQQKKIPFKFTSINLSHSSDVMVSILPRFMGTVAKIAALLISTSIRAKRSSAAATMSDAVAAAGYDNDFFFQPFDHPHERSVLTTDLTQCRIDQCLGWKHFGDFSANGANAFLDILQWKDMTDHLLHRELRLFDEPQRGFRSIVVRRKTTLEFDLTPDQFVHEHRCHGGIPGQAA